MMPKIKVCIGYVVSGEPLNLPDGEYSVTATPPAQSQRTAGASIVRFTDYGDGIEPCETGAFIRYADHQQAVTDALAGQSAEFEATCNLQESMIKEWAQRAEKAEADRDALKESVRLLHEANEIWMNRAHEAEDARDDALAQVAGGQVPGGYALVPHKLTRDMEMVLENEDWQWEDLLTAAEAITEQEYEAIATPQPAPVVFTVPSK